MSTDTALVPASVISVPSRVGQATAIEQSRAAAEVHAAVIVAQQCPRSVARAVAEMREACAVKELAERAFYRYPRGGQSVTGPSIHLARELARVWGNIQYGTAELRRDDEHGESEMQAYAWDVQTNTRSAQIFIVPHRRDKTGGPEKLVDLRDIYENNTNQASRRVRQAIWAVLPAWFTEQAKTLCYETLQKGGGEPLPRRIAGAIDRYAKTFGITGDQLEQRLGRATGSWTEHDLAQLHVTYTSLQRGEITKDEEFPPHRVTAAEITKPARAARAKPEPEPSTDEGGWPDVPKPGGEG